MFDQKKYLGRRQSPSKIYEVFESNNCFLLVFRKCFKYAGKHAIKILTCPQNQDHYNISVNSLENKQYVQNK